MRLLKRILLAIAAIVIATVVLFVIGVLWPGERLEAVRTKGLLAIAGVTVIDVRNGTSRPGQTVLLENGRIAAVAPSVTLPRGTRIIDGRGKYVMPSLWDMHTHVFAFSPLLDLPLYVAYGVTNVRDMQGCPNADDPFVACPEEKREWTAEAIAGKRIGPRIVSSTSWMANGPGMVRRLKNVPPYFDTATPQQARQFVRHFAGRVDAIKVYDGIPRAAYLALSDEARKLGMDVVGHRPRAVSAIETAAHQKSIEHARFLLHESYPGAAKLRTRTTAPDHDDRVRMLAQHDPAMANVVFDAMREHGTWYVPTHLTRWSDAYADTPAVRKDPLLRYLHPLLRLAGRGEPRLPFVKLYREWDEVPSEVRASASPGGREAVGAEDRHYHLRRLSLEGRDAWLVAEVSSLLIVRRMRPTLLAILMPVTVILLLGSAFVAALVAQRSVRQLTELVDAVERNDLSTLRLTDRELVLLAGTLDEALGRVQALLEREKAFVGDVSHELRTPLSVIRGAAELLQRREIDATAAAQIRRIADAARSSEEIIQVLLALAREETAHEERSSIPLLAMIEKLVLRHRDLLGGADIDLRLEIAPQTRIVAPPTVTGEGSWTAEAARIHGLDPAELTTMERGLSFFKGESRAAIEHVQQISEHEAGDLGLLSWSVW